ncbi:hypothetical protein IRT45_12805 [Nocardia sp. BSTN01]|uniref:hypothetical protein n=1 Tax=Nocardia sp. BSTN01 TaxID=2783665 RepID=UPI0018900A73|nr:hypothetical protein [Nocardia sp. BSTN01]MBF4998030.1 hypothetical protein [Nocardia sp. BSTN01]
MADEFGVPDVLLMVEFGGFSSRNSLGAVSILASAPMLMRNDNNLMPVFIDHCALAHCGIGEIALVPSVFAAAELFLRGGENTRSGQSVDHGECSLTAIGSIPHWSVV